MSSIKDNNCSTHRSDEELQKNTVGELKPHDAPITLVEYDPYYADAKTLIIQEIVERANANK